MKKICIYLMVGISVISFGCEQSTKKNDLHESTENPLNNNKELKPIDIGTLKSELGMDGIEQDGQFKITVPQNDLNVTVDGFKIIPPMGLGSWVAFAPTTEQPMIMGDIVVTENDLKPVQQEVIKQGLTITAIHNHFVRNEPDVMYMHIGGMGNEKDLAQSVKAVFDKVAEIRGANPSSAPNSTVENTLDTKLIDSILGYSGTMNNGVYKITIGRPDVDLKEHGAPVSTFLGFNTWASWQGTSEKAAVAGDFTMLASEVAPVIKALIENDIEVVAVHNHMVHEDPRIFFLHYWGVGPVEELAKGLKEALDKTGLENN
ncbi:DUF1259 domain-containing protein [Algoriphagus sp. C2-6-M1]|uniref:DUF1259 domain-containing protein n=1 Tax=Algoriphagus persicinus TaxID=3108754 RepID=UPI002B398582|nr:DUF1259 domain-containing protein [Algoriphagus sp. C2-6-M1]MEB2781432.1 DUF1259 domain-containing protein [Algoriphagus sp. C2-6-M1]